MLKLIAWNICHRTEPWRRLAESDADIALLQEAGKPPDDVLDSLEVDPDPWKDSGPNLVRPPWRTAVVKLSNRVEVEWLQPRSLAEAAPGDLAVSRMGTLAAAIVTTSSGERLIVASMYGFWEPVHESTVGGRFIYADGSVHRVISDLSALVDQRARHRIVAAGDLNVYRGYGERGNSYWASRYATVFNRMEALGLPFVGPKWPAGRRADPWPSDVPTDSDNVPTYYTNRQTPHTASHQLDFVFASSTLSERVRVRALNDVDSWGPSDHCQVRIEIA